MDTFVKFNKYVWDTIGSEVVIAVQSFEKGFLPKRCQHNSTCSSSEKEIGKINEGL